MSITLTPAPVASVPPAPTPAPRRVHRSPRLRMQRTLLTVTVVLIVVVQVYPLLWLFLTSFRTASDFAGGDPFALPREWTLDNYARAFGTGNLLLNIGNSLIVTLGASLLIVVAGMMAAYASQVLGFRLSGFVRALFLLGIIVPVQIALVPLFIDYSQVGLLDTHLSMILPLAAFSLPMGVYLFSSFYEYIPRELYEAASLDGAGPYRIFLQITAPLSVNTIITVVLVNSIFIWNDFIFANTFVLSDGLKTIPLGLQNYIGAMGNTDWTATFAAVCVTVTPLLLVFLVLNKAMIAGLERAEPPRDEREDPLMTTTMRDVAKVAGVSVATVSHVVNDKPGARIGEDARRRVQEAIVALGYRPNALAKTLSEGSSRFIGLVADAIATTPFAGQIIHGAQDEAWRHGFVLLVANTEGNAAAENDAIAMMLEHQVRGILYSTWYHREIQVPPPLQHTETVLVNCFAADDAFPAIVPDEEQGGRTATEQLLAAGHRRIAFVNTTSPSPARSGRLVGYRSALAAAGVEADDALVFEAAPEQEGGYDATAAVIDSGATAVFCHNDRVAMGLYDGLRERGLRIPDDIAVIGFDNQDVIAAHLRPPLSTVALPHYELGAAGVRTLLGLESPATGARQLIVCPSIPRESV